MAFFFPLLYPFPGVSSTSHYTMAVVTGHNCRDIYMRIIVQEDIINPEPAAHTAGGKYTVYDHQLFFPKADVPAVLIKSRHRTRLHTQVLPRCHNLRPGCLPENGVLPGEPGLPPVDTVYCRISGHVIYNHQPLLPAAGLPPCP